jgi:GTP-binding protein HflX
MKENVFLLIIIRKRSNSRSAGDISEEMRELIYSSNGNVIDSMIAVVDKPAPNYFIRSGKLEEIALRMQSLKVKTLITNIDLSPIQARNLEEKLTIKVVDRTGLILDIFAQHAKSREGKLQVELAQYTYLLPRLSIMWEKLSRLGGGIGTRGPGEQILERDRRKVRKHISKLKDELAKVKTHRSLIRRTRKRRESKIISIVGYTNAGKSTLLRSLTGADILVQDKLFATLDPVTRKYTTAHGETLLFTDTVGFLFDLPHGLIEAFHSTLEEINEADLVLVVLDGSNPEYPLHYSVVQKTLKEIEADTLDQIIVCNKTDIMTQEAQFAFSALYPESIAISALEAHGITKLIECVQTRLRINEH